MIRSLLIFFALAGIFLLGLWTQNLRKQIGQLQHRNQILEHKLETRQAVPAEPSAGPPKPGDLSPLQAELNREKMKLEGMKKSLEGLNAAKSAAPDNAVDAHIAEDTAAMGKINGEVNALNQDGKIVNVRSKAYRAQQGRRQKAQREDLKRQLAANTQALHELPEQIKAVVSDHSDPDRMAKAQQLKNQEAALRVERQQLQGQKHALDLQAQQTGQQITAETNSEQNEVHEERAQEISELSRLKSDLDHWKTVKAAQSASLQTQKQNAKTLAQAIAEQTDKIKVLEQNLRAQAGN